MLFFERGENEQRQYTMTKDNHTSGRCFNLIDKWGPSWRINASSVQKRCSIELFHQPINIVVVVVYCHPQSCDF